MSRSVGHCTTDHCPLRPCSLTSIPGNVSVFTNSTWVSTLLHRMDRFLACGGKKQTYCNDKAVAGHQHDLSFCWAKFTHRMCYCFVEEPSRFSETTFFPPMPNSYNSDCVHSFFIFLIYTIGQSLTCAKMVKLNIKTLPCWFVIQFTSRWHISFCYLMVDSCSSTFCPRVHPNIKILLQYFH